MWKSRFELGKCALLDTFSPLSPNLTPLFSPHHVSLISHPVLRCSLLISPHLLIMTSGRRTCLALLGLRWQAGFSKYQHVDLVIRGKKVRLWTQQGGEVDYWFRGFRWSRNGLWLVRVGPLQWIIMSIFYFHSGLRFIWSYFIIFFCSSVIAFNMSQVVSNN